MLTQDKGNLHFVDSNFIRMIIWISYQRTKGAWKTTEVRTRKRGEETSSAGGREEKKRGGREKKEGWEGKGWQRESSQKGIYIVFLEQFWNEIREGQKNFTTKNLNSITVTISLKGIDKIKTEKSDNITVWTMFCSLRLQEDGMNIVPIIAPRTWYDCFILTLQWFISKSWNAVCPTKFPIWTLESATTPNKVTILIVRGGFLFFQSNKLLT